jgi:hypothetical protein
MILRGQHWERGYALIIHVQALLTRTDKAVLV